MLTAVLNARRHADGHARSGEAPAGYGFADEIGDHGLGDLEVRNDDSKSSEVPEYGLSSSG